jgi:hypothetical protein
MFYINTVSSEYPVTEGFIRSEHPNTSFVAPFTSPEPYAFVAESLKPEYDRLTHKLVEGAPVKTDAGYVRQWSVEALPADVVEENQKEALEARESQVRGDRNSLLAQSDWTQGKDISDNVSSAWAAYRQALRDITAQAEFPWGVQWPTQPE